MDKLKIEIDRKAEPPARQSSGITIKQASTSKQTSQIASQVKDALKLKKIPNMITGDSIEDLFKEIAVGPVKNQIGPNELVAFVKKYNPTLDFNVENAKLLIDSLDMDGDGTLGIIEFASLIGKQNPSNDVIEQYRQLYEGLKDGKPKLENAVLISLLKKHNDKDASAMAVIETLVKQADTDGNEHIEFEEFLNLMMDESKDSTQSTSTDKKGGGNNSREFISKRDSMDYVISRNESLRDRVRLIGKYKPSNLKKK
jgi:Ca2+-binding EF-hand superfamily protein